MRKLLFMFIVLVVMGGVSAAFPEIEASILRYEPTPAEQGNTVDVWIQAVNTGEKVENVVVKFEPEYPFSLPPGQPETMNFGTVSALEDKVEKFTLFVDPNAPNGDQEVTFWFRSGVTDDWTEFRGVITVQTQNAVLVIENYTVSPSPVLPGQTMKLDLLLRNAGSIGVKNLDISIDLEDGKFSTIGTGAKQRVDYIGPGGTRNVRFTLASDTTTEVKLYPVPVEMEYQDERNKAYVDEPKISLLVNADPELSLMVDGTDFERRSRPGTVSLQVVNKGVVDVKYLTVKLAGSEEYEILSPSNEEYVGNLDSDDFETVDFIIEPKVDRPRLNVLLEFKDPYNMDFQQRHDLPLRIITEADLGRGGPPWGVIFLLAVIGGGVYWWRKRKKKKKR